MKRRPTKWVKIPASHISAKGLIFKMYKKHIWFQQQTKIKLADGQRVWHFPKQDTQMASTYIKDAQHDWLPKNCKWKLQWDITSDLLNGCYQKKWQDQARKKKSS